VLLYSKRDKSVHKKADFFKIFLCIITNEGFLALKTGRFFVHNVKCDY